MHLSLEMTPPITNMARSFINPKDRAAEVARRRQEAEEELRRRYCHIIN
jgi:hypothetical protein